MDSCDAIIANLTPFRGISADPGTVFEVGYMIGQGKPAFGFTLDNRLYQQRAGATCQDELGHTIEDFEMSDNLMIEGESANPVASCFWRYGQANTRSTQRSCSTAVCGRSTMPDHPLSLQPRAHALPRER